VIALNAMPRMLVCVGKTILQRLRAPRAGADPLMASAFRRSKPFYHYMGAHLLEYTWPEIAWKTASPGRRGVAAGLRVTRIGAVHTNTQGGSRRTLRVGLCGLAWR